MNESIQKAINVIRTGGVVVFPTDTAFGIGCRIDKEDMVKRIFSIRKRPENKATPVLVSSVNMAREWVDEIPKPAQELMEKYWPGGLTIVLNSHDARVPVFVKGGTNTLGVRMPDNDELLSIISEVGVPILAPSANFSGEPTPFTFEELDPHLLKLVDYVLPGETKGKKASTVVDCTVDPFQILRQGAVEL